MKTKIAGLAAVGLSFHLFAADNHFAAANDVVWQGLGVNENNSLPLGNGDLAANVWTETNGDIVLLLAKDDAWSENGQLLKLGRVRVKLDPNPFATPAGVTETLKLESGEVEIKGGDTSANIWIDANHSAVHVEVHGHQAMQLTASTEIWRAKPYHLNQHAVQQAGFFELSNDPDGLDFDSDTVLPSQNNQITWCHFNTHSIYPLVFQKEHLESLLAKYPDPLLHRCFGVTMKGPKLNAVDNQTLKSSAPAKSLQLDLYALTQTADSPNAWQSSLTQVVTTTDAISLKQTRRAHQQWWNNFWDRSWIHIIGTPDAEKISQGYAIQRYMTACAGRGAQPIKFNGSLFTVGHDLPAGLTSNEGNHDPDYRAWGASFWNQNVRQQYWPLIASGDDDLLQPWFNMYVSDLPLAKDRTREYFHHDGGAFIETIYFWGLPNINDFGWDNSGNELSSEWMRYHIQGGLEVLAQMLDRYEYTQDADFAKVNILPMADANITYYDQHWKRDDNGKIRMSPSQSIETYQVNAVNPTPDIAGLMDVLPRLLALPTNLTTDAERDLWNKVLKDLPPLPMGTTAKGKLPPKGQGDPDGKRVILPAEKYGGTHNSENPELYTVFPYRLYGMGKPDLNMARDTYTARLFPFNHCWGQDGMEAALLGLTADAQEAALREFTCYGKQQFSWFWAKNNDWIPDMDNGGSGMETLQFMVMQCDGQRIQLLPAWPNNWTADFRLHAPYQTTVTGHIENGKLTELKVVPENRAKDVVIVPPAA